MKIISYIHLHAQESHLYRLLDFLLFNISYTRIRIGILIENIANRNVSIQSKEEIRLSATFYRYLNELNEKIITKGIRRENKNFIRALLDSTDLNIVDQSDNLCRSKLIISDVVTSTWGGNLRLITPIILDLVHYLV